MIWPYFRIASPSLIGRTANLWPIRIAVGTRRIVAVECDVGIRGNRLSANRDVILRPEVNGKIGKRRGGHRGAS